MRFVSSFLAATATILLLAVAPPLASAGGTPPFGTLSCSVFSDRSPTHPAGILFHPYINSVPRLLLVKAVNVGSSCDNDGVTGGKAPITGVAFKFTGRLEGGTCSAFTTMPSFKNARIKLKWRGLNPVNRPMTVATSKARVASASYDTGAHALVLTTEPLTGAGFTGEIVTLRLGIEDDVDYIESGCSADGGLLAFPFGNFNTATLDVQ